MVVAAGVSLPVLVSLLRLLTPLKAAMAAAVVAVVEEVGATVDTKTTVTAARAIAGNGRVLKLRLFSFVHYYLELGILVSSIMHVTLALMI